MKPNKFPHVDNPIKYANKTMQILKGNVGNCDFAGSMVAYVGLANRYIEDAFYEEQINKKTMVDMYNELSDILKEFDKRCKCMEKI